MTLDIRVEIGLSSQLASFLTAFMQSRPETTNARTIGETPETSVEAIGQKAEPEAPKAKPKVKAKKETKPEPEAPKEAKEEKSEEEPAAPSAKEEEKKPLTSREVIRDIIHITRQRIEGENYKENTTSERYQKYHKALNGEFKRISVPLGADKPSLLADDKIESFRAACEAIIIGEDGELTTQIPF